MRKKRSGNGNAAIRAGHMRRSLAGMLFVLCLGATVAGAEGGDGYRLLRLDGRHVKWGAGEAGTGAVLSYAIATEASVINGERNCLRMGGIEPILARSGLGREVFAAELRAALAMWEAAADIRFVPANGPDVADIVVGAEIGARDIAFADISVAPGSDDEHAPAVAAIAKGRVCLNPEHVWTSELAPRAMHAAGPADERRYELRYTLAHEVGHVLGLDHPGAAGELMSFRYQGNSLALQPGDIAGAVALYGPPPGAAAFARGNGQLSLD